MGYADMLNSYELTRTGAGEATYYIFSQGKRLESLSHKLLELVGMDRQEIGIQEDSDERTGGKYPGYDADPL
ncbi:MAG: hypothetical protein ACLVGL_06820 [Waltera sp.]